MARSIRGPSRRGFLSGAAALGLGGLLAPTLARAATERHLVVVWNGGGWDTTAVFDPHFGSSHIDRDPAAEAASSGGLDFAASTSRPAVADFFGRFGERSCIVNGISVGSISHPGCTRLALTGFKSSAAPDLPGILASRTAGICPIPHAVLSGPRYPGELGAVMVPVNELFSTTLRGLAPSASAWNRTDEDRIQQFLADEADRWGSGPRLEGWAEGLQRLDRLEEDAQEIVVGADPDPNDLVDLAVELLRLGLSRTVIVDAGLPLQTLWDSHGENHENQDRAYQHAFEVLKRLVDRLDRQSEGGTSLLDRTTVLFLSEMGRSPGLNTADGKDHWPYTSALLVGAGVSGGSVLGATDDRLVAQKVDMGTGQASASGRLLTSASFLAGVLQAFDVDPGAYFPDDPPFTAAVR